MFDLDHCPDITDLLKGQEHDHNQANKVVLIVSPEKNRTDPGYHANDELKNMDGMVTSDNNGSDVIGGNEKRQ
jgi:hypothetical protein